MRYDNFADSAIKLVIKATFLERSKNEDLIFICNHISTIPDNLLKIADGLVHPRIIGLPKNKEIKRNSSGIYNPPAKQARQAINDTVDVRNVRSRLLSVD